MSTAYKAVGWNRQKRVYDFLLLGGVLASVSTFAAITALRFSETTAETFLLRWTSTSAFLLLHVILAIGPLSRLEPRFLPLLYNRRHLGVSLAFLAVIHAALAIFQFHAFGDRHPLVSVFTAYSEAYGDAISDPRLISQIPFEIFGFGALIIVLLMAVTSHDFWLRQLGPSTWKVLHQSVYAAYALLLAHVLFGVVQAERSFIYPAWLALGFVVLVTLHVLAWRKERALDSRRTAAETDGFFPVAELSELRAKQGHVVVVEGERFALFVQDDRLFALSNVCRHQGGPLGEGRLVSGCVTCPWHGYQYRAADGCSPPPFTEVAPTYSVRVVGTTIFLSPKALPPKTVSAGVPISTEQFAPENLTVSDAPLREFYIGWQAKCPPLLASFLRKSVLGLAGLVPLVIGSVVAFQMPIDRGHYDFGHEQVFEGVLFEKPIARLRMNDAQGVPQDFVIVSEGKFGPPKVLSGADGHRVRFTGTLIERPPLRLVELHQPDRFAILDPQNAPAVENTPGRLGEGTLIGELVDTKCFSGVMRPATGKVHRGCAVRCLSGGVPPGLLVRDASGNGVVLLLAGLGNEPLRFDVQLAGRIVRARGKLELEGSTPVLRTAEIVAEK